MTPSEEPILELLGDLNRQDPGGILPRLLEMLAPVGAIGVRLFLADIEERVLQSWGEAGAGAAPPVRAIDINGSPHGEAYVTGQLVTAEVETHPALIAPVVARAERVGVLEVRLEAPANETAQVTARGVALIVGYVILAADHWTDSFHVARRRRDMALPAEIQWNLLPLAAFSTPRVALGAAVEPAYDIGGDVFDYACGTQELTVGMFDAMGHGLAAAQLSSLTVNAFRNARRRGLELAQQAKFIHESLAGLMPLEGFVTGQLIKVDLGTPQSSLIVNAGHLPPFLQRGSLEPVQVKLRPNLPFGLLPNPLLAPEVLELQSGDRLTLFTDGLVEAIPDGGVEFGLDRLADYLRRLRHYPPREVARIVTTAVVKYRLGNLRDDSTILVLDIP